MKRLNTYYDRFVQRWGLSLGGALVYSSSYVMLIVIGILQVRDHHRHPDDTFALYIAPFSLSVGILGILHAIQVIRAVRRSPSL